LVLGLALAAGALSGCSFVGGGSATTVRLVNLTNGPVAVDVDGAWVGTYEAGASADVPLRGHQPPFVVRVRSLTGNVYVELPVTAEGADGAAMGTGGASVTAELPCGVVRLTIGRVDEPPPSTPEAILHSCG
jgi:hypothetical protein